MRSSLTSSSPCSLLINLINTTNRHARQPLRSGVLCCLQPMSKDNPKPWGHDGLISQLLRPSCSPSLAGGKPGPGPEHKPALPMAHQTDKALPHLSWVRLANVSKGQHGKSCCWSSHNRILPMGWLQGRFMALCNGSWHTPAERLETRRCIYCLKIKTTSNIQKPRARALYLCRELHLP